MPQADHFAREIHQLQRKHQTHPAEGLISIVKCYGQLMMEYGALEMNVSFDLINYQKSLT